MKGIIYIMTTAVSGLIKIGQTGTNNYQERMRNLEANGYYNVAGLKRFFAIELEDYADQEKEFDVISNVRRESRLFSFYKKGLKNGDVVVFKDDEKITAKIVGEREVEYEGQIWKLSPLTYKLYEQRGELNES